MSGFMDALKTFLDGSEAAPATTPAAASPEPAQTPSGASGVPDAAVELVTQFEGFSAVPYQDPVGVWTIGYGSTRDLRMAPVCATTAPVTETEGALMVKRDLSSACQTVQGDVQVPLNDNQKAALEDFVYNLGMGNFKSSTLLRKLNAGDYAGAAAEFDKWDMAGGKVLAGLLRRRQAETDLFGKPA